MNIKQRRLAFGLTQEDVAESIGVKRAAVAQWEAERRLPRTRFLPALAKLFHCTVDDLLKEEEE